VPLNRQFSSLAPLPNDYYALSAEQLAPKLLGKILGVKHNGEWLLSELVEVGEVMWDVGKRC